MTLPVALSGTDVIGQAKTGTGKTLGFGLPLLERVTVPADVEAGRAKPEQLTDAPQALVVVPTRELCTQVTNDLLTAGKVRNVRVLAIYGGRAYEPQVEALRKGVDVIVGTPGRLLDLAGQRKLDLSKVRALVLDEADEMLDLGFLPDVEKIIQQLPARRQTMLFSATMPGAVIGLARRYMSQPTHIRATAPDDEGATVANITQRVYRAHSMDKPEMVSRILQADGRGLAMIFCRTKRTAADIAEQLARRGFASGAVHGDLGQGAREQALRAFRNGKVDVLVCTDVAARGIDVDGVTHVINYQSPEDEKTYLHRVGRTGRAGKSGTAVTLVDWDDIPRWQLINKALGLGFAEPAETYSTSPHLFEELGIPEGTKGVLPRAERTRAGLAAEELEDLGETGGRGRKAAAVTEERPARTRTPRQRRRTRAGAPASAGTPSGSGASGAADGSAASGSTGSAGAVGTAGSATSETGAAEPRVPRRRRRTRVGAPSAPAPVETLASAPVAESAPPAEPVAVVEPQPVAEPVVESAPRRRRTRAVKAVTPVEAAETASVETAPVGAPAPEAEPEAKPKRTRKRAVKAVESTGTATAVEASAVTAAPEAEATEAKPRRRTRAVKAVESAEAAAPEAEAKPKRTRSRAVKAVDTAEAPGPEAKPKRTRAVKTVTSAASAEASSTLTAAGTIAVPAGTAEAKPKRTRARAVKSAASAEAAVSAVVETPAEPEAKPRRRTRTAKAAAQPES
ncbi:DEAD/DEAH box helicase [Streptomyces sp. NPDC051018]|uniref:DEAD/DEAH box helicase n=1 Tax=Streptomyces sp. NPDC051018 TaxID=3365639 RepID=UPI0037BDC03C